MLRSFVYKTSIKSMKKQHKFILGIDVSKKTFDIAIGKNEPESEVTKSNFTNNLKGFQKLDSWFEKLGISYSDCLFCMENTGIYHRILAGYLKSKKSFVWVESGVQIKWSMGLQRGKSDPEDAKRIMTYAFRYQDKARDYSRRDNSLQQIADYLSLRLRLQGCMKSLSVPIKELKSVGLTASSALLEKASRGSIAAIKKELEKVDQKIKDLISKDEELSKKYKYATSVKSIGYVAGVSLLVYTEGFTKFRSSKQIASYAGIAPFEYSSGTSIRGRTKVHPMGNKTLKTILHLCAVSSLSNNPEMKIYFKRKVDEGKNKMLVLNAIRNKLVARVFSCVKNEKMYVDNLVAA